jgi:hypothetical protein
VPPARPSRLLLSKSRGTVPVGAPLLAEGDGEGVHHKERFLAYPKPKLLAQKPLPELLLYGPEVGCLAQEGGAVDLAEGRKPLPVVAPEELVETLISVSIPKNSPTTSMVRISASESLGRGPRARRSSPLSRSSIKQKTLTIKVSRSIGRRPSYFFVGCGTTRVGEVFILVQSPLRNLHMGLKS